jgi:excisionase family DNA binding protein
MEVDRLLLSIDEAAKQLSVSARYLWTMQQRGEIPFVRIGRRVLFAVKDLEKWIEERRETLTPAER